MMQDLNLLTYLTAVIIAVIACFTDLRSRKIPNVLVLSGFALGAGLNLWSGGWQGLGMSLAGGCVGLALFLPFFALGGMGAGDVKLLAALGIFVGPTEILKVALVAALAGGVLAFLSALWHGRLVSLVQGITSLLGFWFRDGFKVSPVLNLANPSTLKIPYALPVATGLIIVVLSHWR